MPSPVEGAPRRGELTLRPQLEEDSAFLLRLYTDVRWEELKITGWPDAAKHAFLADQFTLQTRHYSTYYADASFDIIEEDGEAIGRLYVHRGPRELRVVDISIVSHRRGAGIGGALLRAVGAEAAAAGKIVSIHVEHFNPARALYRRIGFEEREARGPYLLMEWEPGARAR